MRPGGRIFVSGAAGFIGSSLVDRLLTDGYDVTGLDSFAGYYPREIKARNLASASKHPNFRLVEADLSEIGLRELREILSDASHVVHLAARPGVRASWSEDFPDYLDQNVRATQRLLEASVRATGGGEGPRFVFASSSSVYGSAGESPCAEDDTRAPISPYAYTKVAAEDLVATYARSRDLDATVLRYFTVYGPRQRPEMALSRFIRAARRREPVEVYGDGDQVREMTFVSDVVEATVHALEAPGGTYNVGGGERTTVNRLVRAVGEELGVEIEVRSLPAVGGDARSTWADLSRSQEYLGYRPRVGISEGVRAQIEWSKHNLIA